MIYSTAYYPEHTSEEQIDKDIKLMKEAGINAVRTAEFAWSLLEVSEGQYDFLWLDNVIERLGNAGIKTVIGTPTAVAPKWLLDKHPEICQTMENGESKGYGTRRNVCINNPDFIEHSLKITREIAKHYKDNENVIAYQIDNELMAEKPYCYCNECLKKFRYTMQKKYKDISNLNRAWGLNFWSLNFPDWESVEMPKTRHSQPSALKNYYEFFSDCYIEFCLKMAEEIRNTDSKKIITHNICSSGFLFRMDLGKLFSKLNITSLDFYPTWRVYREYETEAKGEFKLTEASFALALTRAYRNEHFWITEKATPSPKNPNQFEMLTMLEMAQGARMFGLFEWRKPAFGQEQGHPSILSYDSVPRGCYKTIENTFKKLKVLENIKNALPHADIALIRDFQSDFCFMAKSPGGFHYLTFIYEFYKAVVTNHINCDIIMPDADFSKYKIVIAPAKKFIDNVQAKKIMDFVADGGIYITSIFSAYVNKENVALPDVQPCMISDVAGIEIEDTLINQYSPEIISQKSRYGSSIGCDFIVLKTAQAISWFDHEKTQRTPAVTKNAYGKGAFYYIGTLPDPEYLNKFINDILIEEGMDKNIKATSPDVEIVKNVDREDEYYFCFNYGEEPQKLTLKQPMYDMFNEQLVKDEIYLEGESYIVLKNE